MSAAFIFQSIGGYLFIGISLLSFLFFVKSQSIIDVIFLVPAVNYLILAALFFLGVSFSYLETEEDTAYYLSVAIFDLTYFCMLFVSLATFISQRQIIKSLRYFANNLVLVFGSVLVILNLLWVARYFGQPYGEIANQHTPLSEIGWILLALFLLSHYPKGTPRPVIFWIACLILISLPFGARMQPSFAILALIALISHFKGKLHAAAAYFCLASLSIWIGILRDLNFSAIDDISNLLAGVNQGAVFRTSAVILQYYESLSSGQVLMNTFSTFLAYPVSGTVFTGEGVFLNYELQAFSPIQGNGGNIGTLMYFYFGPFSLILTVFFFAIVSRYKPLTWIIPLLVVTSFRWQQYNLIPLLKITPLIFMLLIVIQILPRKVMRLS